MDSAINYLYFKWELEIELLEYADSFVLFKHLDYCMWDDKLVITSNEEVVVIHSFTFWVETRNSTGNITSVQIRVKVRPIVSSIPMLAVPWCDENIRLEKAANEVRAL